MVYNRKWFFYRAIAEIINENSFDLLKVMKKYYYQEKRGNGYVIGSRDQRQKSGHRA